MIRTKDVSPPDQEIENRRKAAAAAISVHLAIISQVKRRNRAFDSSISTWARPNWLLKSRLMMTNRWPYW
jgi:hypothetical protein